MWAGKRVMAAFVAVFLAAVVAHMAPAGAEDLSTADPEGARELADRYAPIMMLKAQEEPCDDKGEPYGPTTIDIVLDNPEVVLRQVGRGDPVIMTAPGASDLFGLGEGIYVDFPGSALEPGCIYEADFNRYSDGLPATVYAHIVQQQDHPDQLVLQYWFYWYYNDWNNKHESDWEGIALLFEASSIQEALASEPVRVGYSQHEGGEWADWDARKLEREGSHPVVYSSAGSHASYYGSALYIGRSGSEGFGCDNTDGPSERLETEVVVLPDSVDDPDDPLAWLAFEGRWGERQSGPFNGPTGPTAKDRWLEPIDWFEELRSTSVVIPSGDSQGSAVISTFCDIVEWGSGALIQMTTSPLRLLISLVVALVVARWLIRRTEWSRIETLPLIRRRRAGQILRASWSGYRRDPGVLTTFGLIYIPVAVVVGLFGAFLTIVPVLRDLLDLAGTSSGTSTVVALVASGFAHLAAYVAVNAMVVTWIAARERDQERSAVEAARLVWDHRAPLFKGFARAFVIVVGLGITIVGIPWSLRQLVRYQFLPHAVMYEGHDGRDGLARSSDLVTGRWWHTALMFSLLNSLVGLTGLVVGLLLLVLFAGLPLWFFSGLVTLIYALVVPLAALALTLLYGDASAEQTDAVDADLVTV